MNKNLRNNTFIKLLSWAMFFLFAISLSFTFFLYNISSVFNEKNLKEIGEKAVSELFEESRVKIIENYDLLQEFANTAPNEELDIPTGIQNFSLKIKGSDIQNLSKEEFFSKLPGVITENTYDNYVGNLVKNNNNDNALIYNAIINELEGSKENKSSLVFLYITIFSFFACLFLSDIKKIILKLGILITIISLPIYIMFYLFQPFIEATIRKTNFVFAAFMVSDLLNQIESNYLLLSISGVLVIIIGFLIKFDLKDIIPRKKSEFEKVIK